MGEEAYLTRRGAGYEAKEKGVCWQRPTVLGRWPPVGQGGWILKEAGGKEEKSFGRARGGVEAKRYV